MKSTYKIFLFLLITQFGFSQNPIGQNIFDNSYLHEIRISFESNDYWVILDDNYQNSLDENKIPHDVPYLVANIEIDGNSLDSVGIRQKGYSSNFLFPNKFKKSLKIDFNEFVKSNKYDGLKKINLNNGFGDPSMQRDFLAYDLMRNADIKASRVAYTKVFLNDTFWGVYEMIEQVDKTFLKSHFENGKGDLYKNIGFSTLEWKGDSRVDYESDFALKTNKKKSDFSSFIHFIDVLNNTDDVYFADSIASVFNVDDYLKVLAIDVMTDNWDSYIDHGRNFYLYHDPISGLMNWIPWDYNFALGAKLRNESDSLPDNLGECVSIKNGSCPYPSTDPIFIEVVNTRPNCCNNNWDQPCQGIYDQIAGNGGGDLPSDPNDCTSIKNGSCPYPASDPIYLAVIEANASCCNDTWSPICGFIYTEIAKEFKPRYFDFPLIIEKDNLVLINRILNVPAYKKQYLKYCCQILNNNFTIERLSMLIDHNTNLVAEGIKNEPNYPFAYADFLYDTGVGSDSHKLPSLKEFVNHRVPILESELLVLGTDCSTVGTEDYHDGSIFSVFPNPAQSHVTIDFFGRIGACNNIQIFNSLGQLFYFNSKLVESNIVIPIQNWESGIYFIKVEMDGIIRTKRLIKL